MSPTQPISSAGNDPAATLTFGHSPDPDDAYMFYGFASDAVRVELETPGGEKKLWRVEHILEDIQSLNERAATGELEITAISAHTYPYVADRYWVMRTGVSMGDGYGPIMVAREAVDWRSLRGRRIAIPGERTTAALATRMLLEDFEPVPVFFDQIQQAVREGRADAGVVIHEGQLTFEADGVHKIADLGVLWREQTGHPLPLGLDVVRKDLGPDLAAACSRALRASIEYARAHRSEAMAYALEYGRGLDLDLGTRFVEMYVNDWTLDMGEAGRTALRVLLDRAADRGLTPRVADWTLV